MSNRTLTFTERVAYQRAIEEIYWRHRIWPKENPQPKPPLDAIISQGLLERKVEECLRKSQLVADPRGWPITPSELQAEMDRMARDTKQPDVLRELFVALGNDPFVVAECLAGPKATARQGTADSTAGAIVDVAQLLRDSRSFERPDGASWRRNFGFLFCKRRKAAPMVGGRNT